jgi:AcrR family transcriptional regulator
MYISRVTNSVDRSNDATGIAGEHAASERGDATRRSIVEATIGLIGDVGWAAVTTRQVARRAGVTQGVIHYHFGSKEALLRAAMAVATTQLLVEPAVRLADAAELGSGLRELLAALGSIEADSQSMRVSTEALGFALRDPELASWLGRELAAFRAGLARLLRGAADRGEARADLDPEGTAVLVTAALDGLLFHRAVDPALDLDTAATTLITMLAEPQAKHRR